MLKFNFKSPFSPLHWRVIRGSWSNFIATGITVQNVSCLGQMVVKHRVFLFQRWQPCEIMKFKNVKFLVASRVWTPMHITVLNFIENDQTIMDYGDTAFILCTMAAVCYLNFLNICYFWTAFRVQSKICAIVQNLVKIGQTVAEISRFSAILVCGPHFGTTHKKYLVVFTARRYAKRGICHRRVCVRLCVCVWHTPVLYQNG